MSNDTAPEPAKATEPIELSIVMPCLDEAETLAICIGKAQEYLARSGVRGEVVIADNGSTDGSQEIAKDLGARVVDVPRKGYGSALRGGIEASRGTYVIMGDADDSYDFLALDDFVRELRAGHDLVMGNRFKGGIEKGAMPWLHYWIGNPILTLIGRIFFRSPMGDFHCGLRGFRKDAYEKMRLRSTGMEFASEMVIKATLNEMSMAEVPTVLSPDGRTRAPHLRTWRDGWRHLRFMLLFSPRWLFLVPGIALFSVGAVLSLVLMSGSLHVGNVEFDVQTLFASSLLCLLGYQLIVFAVFTKAFAVTEGFHPPPRYYDWIFRYLNLETGVVAGAVMLVVGLAFVVAAFLGWREQGFGPLDPSVTMRQLGPGGVLSVIGLQTIYSSFFLSILGMDRD